MIPVEIEQTPMDVFAANAAVATKRISVVLVSTGSLNPVHLAHVRMLEAAARTLNEAGKVKVLAAWISPSDAFWSRAKPYGALSNEVAM